MKKVLLILLSFLYVNNNVVLAKELNINDVYYDGCLDRHKQQGSHLRYTCYNPKLIVCVENNKLKLYKIYPANKNTKYKSRNIVINEQLYDP